MDILAIEPEGYLLLFLRSEHVESLRPLCHYIYLYDVLPRTKNSTLNQPCAFSSALTLPTPCSVSSNWMSSKSNRGAGRWNGIFMKGCTPRLPPTLQVAKVCAESVPITFPPAGCLVPGVGYVQHWGCLSPNLRPCHYQKRMPVRILWLQRYQFIKWDIEYLYFCSWLLVRGG